MGDSSASDQRTQDTSGTAGAKFSGMEVVQVGALWGDGFVIAAPNGDWHIYKNNRHVTLSNQYVNQLFDAVYDNFVAPAVKSED